MIIQHFFLILLISIALSQSQDLDNIEGFSNDSPFNIEPKKIRAIIGTPINQKCSKKISNQTVWEYKQCGLYKAVMCDLEEINIIKSREKSTWKRHSIKQRLEIESIKEHHSGLYRCVEKGVVKSSYIIDVVESYKGPPPLVQSLITSNITGQLNMEFTIQCNISSAIPPTIIWFKKCYGSKCDIEYNETCYCHLNNIPTSSYNSKYTYISKINIFNAKEIDSGLYACLAVTEYGKDYKSVTISVPDSNSKRTNSGSLELLFLIPLTLILTPLMVWLWYIRRKKKPSVVVTINGHHHQQVLINENMPPSIRSIV